MFTTPCGTTRFSRFLRNSFLRLEAFAAAAAGAPPGDAAASFGSFATLVSLLSFRALHLLTGVYVPAPTCEPRSSSLPPRPSADPCAYARWCGCAVREPANCGGDESRGTPEFQSGG